MSSKCRDCKQLKLAFIILGLDIVQAPHMNVRVLNSLSEGCNISRFLIASHYPVLIKLKSSTWMLVLTSSLNTKFCHVFIIIITCTRYRDSFSTRDVLYLKGGPHKNWNMTPNGRTVDLHRFSKYTEWKILYHLTLTPPIKYQLKILSCNWNESRQPYWHKFIYMISLLRNFKNTLKQVWRWQ